MIKKNKSVLDIYFEHVNLQEGKYGRMAGAYGKAWLAMEPFNVLTYGAWGLVMGPLLGHVLQKRLNSMYYECRSIQDPGAKIKCRLRLLDQVHGILRSKLQDETLSAKQRNSIYEALSHYSEAKQAILTQGKATMSMESADHLNEAFSGGWWKGLLVPGILAPVAQSRMERAFYHCKELQGFARTNCQKQMLSEILSILKQQRMKEPYNVKIEKKILEVEQRLSELGYSGE